MNFLHHLGDKWRVAWEAALRMADHVLVETPTDDGACGQQYLTEINTEVERNAGHILGTFARHTGKGHSMLYHIESESQKKLIRPYWVLPKDKAARDSRLMGQHDLRINSTFSEKALIHGDRGQQPPWVPGINAMTYRALGGVYPRAETIRTWASELPSGPDMNLWNLILSGDGLSVIDQHGNHESLLLDYLP